MLLQTNFRVSEICFKVGFNNLEHFNRVFKKITKYSPSQFRAKSAYNPR
ncbi:MAG: helix-turn-helix domain-containing protein [bacterium]